MASARSLPAPVRHDLPSRQLRRFLSRRRNGRTRRRHGHASVQLVHPSQLLPSQPARPRAHHGVGGGVPQRSRGRGASSRGSPGVPFEARCRTGHFSRRASGAVESREGRHGAGDRLFREGKDVSGKSSRRRGGVGHSPFGLLSYGTGLLQGRGPSEKFLRERSALFELYGCGIHDRGRALLPRHGPVPRRPHWRGRLQLRRARHPPHPLLPALDPQLLATRHDAGRFQRRRDQIRGGGGLPRGCRVGAAGTRLPRRRGEGKGHSSRPGRYGVSTTGGRSDAEVCGRCGAVRRPGGQGGAYGYAGAESRADTGKHGSGGRDG
mmetsp:Transcript_16092/g.36200  ORF Transcript_16092/g.36200 Transcript_16092/m.36200 type:complete len:322 (-) Transcript_16092:369-1334(-)